MSLIEVFLTDYQKKAKSLMADKLDPEALP